MRVTTLLLLTLLSLGAQAAGKTAFFNFKQLLEQSPQAIAATAVLKEEFGEREQSLRKLAQGIQQMEKTYQTDSAIMSDEQKKKAEENIVQNKRRFQFEQQSLKEDFQVKQRELLQEVQQEIGAVIQAYGKDNGYDFIFTENGIAFGSDSVNITEQLLEKLKK
jgi:outer membrane protein